MKHISSTCADVELKNIVYSEQDLDIIHYIENMSFNADIAYDRQTLKEMMEDEKFKFSYIVRQDEVLNELNPVGYVSIEMLPNSIYLDSFGILPEYQNMGFGTKIITEIISKYKNITLHAQTHEAVNFYSKFGFTILNEHDADGVLMILSHEKI
jgi:ribosomal protein S18 acetylase RimI-like enzyme